MNSVSLNSSAAVFRQDMNSILASQLAQSSIKMYTRDIQAYISFANAFSLDLLSSDTLMAWRDDLTLHTTKSPKTINRMLSAVKRLVKEASIRKQIDHTISLEFHEVQGVKEKALKHRLKAHSRTRITAADVRRLCDAPPSDTLVGLRDRALLATLASSGCRISEVASLTLEQIRQQGADYLLEVRGKTDIEMRDANLSIEAFDHIQRWLSARNTFIEEQGYLPSAYIFSRFDGRGNRYDPEQISESGGWTLVRRYAEQCGLKHITPHTLRRFVGTELAKIDIRKAQKALGHASIETTARHYVLDDLEAGLTNTLY